MRTIALAIVLAGAGLEYAILRANNEERDYAAWHGIFTLVTLIAFIVCLILGI